MRRTVAESGHGKTTPDRCTSRQAGAAHCGDHNVRRIPAPVPSGSAAGLVWGHPRTNRHRSGRGPGHRGAAPGDLPQDSTGAAQSGAQLGRTSAISAYLGGGSRVLETLVDQRRHRQLGGGFPDSSRAGATPGQSGQALRGLPVAGSSWLAKGGPGHPPPQEQTRGSGGLEKNSPKCWQPC